MTEIERKFLVTSNAYKTEANKVTPIQQGFLNTSPERTVRVRIIGGEAFLTVKGKSSANGLSRFEWETKIDKDDAAALLNLCEEGIITKIRYRIKVGNHTFEVDEFLGNNAGLTLAEVELNTETETYIKPNWLGKEVTGNVKYYNSQLSKNPYKNWKK